MYILEKVSLPDWVKTFDNPQDRIDELRKHICETCLIGEDLWVGENGDLVVNEEWEGQKNIVDLLYDGVRYECRDIKTLLHTPCGLEYEIGDEEWN